MRLSPGEEGAHVTPELFERPFLTLGHGLDPGQQGYDGKQENEKQSEERCDRPFRHFGLPRRGCDGSGRTGPFGARRTGSELPMVGHSGRISRQFDGEIEVKGWQ
jgi:hypothetical protein